MQLNDSYPRFAVMPGQAGGPDVLPALTARCRRRLIVGCRQARRSDCDTADMWIDDAGVLHTVALPNPTEPMAPDFRDGLDTIIAERQADLRKTLELAEERVYDSEWSNLPSADSYVAAPPPVGLLQGAIATPEDVAQVIAEVDPRWRLDAVMAIVEYMDRH